ncbi:uncharacterized protein LAESUDRAFT_761150 [Laetiporus sulphureus 93-53]|uniref:Uncharacterized protein n=1 Tax=Laetiporus sulphureus 93-53 TaxID=1314785 RepID=A0A165D7W4_9APHY|nr:uncharacterized protein LAESUDRAFT_761150 [Laetiporus sulphureus 93-53]KZT04294.1 hypothetical protein LAESUDRAFT_761150 [Laetiporus sulphureus 93-53]
MRSFTIAVLALLGAAAPVMSFGSGQSSYSGYQPMHRVGDVYHPMYHPQDGAYHAMHPYHGHAHPSTEDYHHGIQHMHRPLHAYRPHYHYHLHRPSYSHLGHYGHHPYHAREVEMKRTDSTCSNKALLQRLATEAGLDPSTEIQCTS